MPIEDSLSRRSLQYVSASAVFLTSVVMVMLGPILVPIAADFDTSLAVAGQLAAVTSMIWGVAAIPVGPVSDTYGRRRVLLTGIVLIVLALVAGALAQSFGAMLAARIVTGIAAAMIPPTCYAACADYLPPAQATRALSWSMAGGLLGGALGMPLVALIANHSDWRAPFQLLSVLLLLQLLVVWAIFPRHVPARSDQRGMMSIFRDLGSRGPSFWLLPAANFLLQSASWGTLSYLPAYLMKTYQLNMGGITLPLLLNGLGIMGGAFAGGMLANHPLRKPLVIGTLPVAGLLLSIAFTISSSVWLTVVLTAAAGSLFVLSQPLLLTLALSRAGAARGTATGIFALSTQLGAMSGAALGGVLLSIGGFAFVGIGCFVTALAASQVVRLSLREHETAAEGTVR